jgi:hypothetical protein
MTLLLSRLGSEVKKLGKVVIEVVIDIKQKK